MCQPWKNLLLGISKIFYRLVSAFFHPIWLMTRPLVLYFCLWGTTPQTPWWYGSWPFIHSVSVVCICKTLAAHFFNPPGFSWYNKSTWSSNSTLGQKNMYHFWYPWAPKRGKCLTLSKSHSSYSRQESNGIQGFDSTCKRSFMECHVISRKGKVNRCQHFWKLFVSSE